MTRKSTWWCWFPILFIIFAAGCRSAELQKLREENARLKDELEKLKLAGAGELKLLRIDEFTVGLAASEKTFDEGAFTQLLKNSLQEAALKDARFTFSSELDEQQIAKIRGMLVQQYISEKKVPIRLSNLTYKLKDPRPTSRSAAP